MDSTQLWQAIDNQDTTGLSEELMHPFEFAGLGTAPFSYAGCEDTKGTCQFCGRAIATKYHVKDSTGKLFHVGCNCIEKTCTDELVSEVKFAKKQIARDRRLAKKQIARDRKFARETAQIQEARELIKRHQPALAALPHPNSYLASTSQTYLDYLDWRILNRVGPWETIRLIQIAVSAF